MTDPFSAKHSKMPRSRRAKIFAPFNALDGYNSAIDAKNVSYVERAEPAEEESAEIDRRLKILRALVPNSRLAKERQIVVTITWFEPCRDENIFCYQKKGLYKTVTGICRKVDTDLTHTIQAGDQTIRISDILRIEAEDERVFSWAEDTGF